MATKGLKRRHVAYQYSLDFGRKCSLHGLYRIVDKESKIFGRLYWLLLLVFSLIGLGVLICICVRRYQEHGTYLSFDDVPSTEQRFPAVTICSNRAFRNGKAGETLDHLAKIRQEKHPTGEEVDKSNRLLWLMLQRYYQEASVSEREEMGIRYEEMIADCEFQYLQPCHRTSFTSFHSHYYGTCYTFASYEHPKFTYGASNLQGLTIHFNSKAILENFRKLQMSIKNFETDQMSIVLHDPRSFPDFECNTQCPLHVPLTGVTTIQMKKVVRVRKPLPYKTACIDSESDAARNLDVFTYLFDNLQYNQYTCQETCTWKIQMRRCGCAWINPFIPKDLLQSPAFASYDDKFGMPRDLSAEYSNKTLDYLIYQCRNATPETYSCLYDAWLQFFNEKNDTDLCYCPNPCVETNYEVAARDVQPFPVIGPNDDDLLGNITHRPGILQIYYQTAGTHVIKQEAAYSIESLLGDVGGLLGLFSGISVLTLFEIMEFLVDIFIILLQRK